MTVAIAVWWHWVRTGHLIDERRVSVPAFDMSARGILYECTVCPDRTWAR